MNSLPKVGKGTPHYLTTLSFSFTWSTKFSGELSVIALEGLSQVSPWSDVHSTPIGMFTLVLISEDQEGASTFDKDWSSDLFKDVLSTLICWLWTLSLLGMVISWPNSGVVLSESSLNLRSGMKSGKFGHRQVSETTAGSALHVGKVS